MPVQALLDGVTAAFYNAFFTAGPISVFALFDRPVRNLNTLLEFPQHYNRRPQLTTRVFWKTGILWAITHAVVSTLPLKDVGHFFDLLTVLQLACVGIGKTFTGKLPTGWHDGAFHGGLDGKSQSPGCL